MLQANERVVILENNVNITRFQRLNNELVKRICKKGMIHHETKRKLSSYKALCPRMYALSKCHEMNTNFNEVKKRPMYKAQQQLSLHSLVTSIRKSINQCSQLNRTHWKVERRLNSKRICSDFAQSFFLKSTNNDEWTSKEPHETLDQKIFHWLVN